MLEVFLIRYYTFYYTLAVHHVGMAVRVFPSMCDGLKKINTKAPGYDVFMFSFLGAPMRMLNLQ